MKGDVVVLNFPFSDLSLTKRRPALVLAALQGNDLILRQITSQTCENRYSVRFDSADFVTGGLGQSSRIRPNRLFTAASPIVAYRAGQLSAAKLTETRETLIRILSE